MTILKIFGIILIIFFLAHLAKRPFRRRTTNMRLSHSGFPKGLEAACFECGVSCKLFIPKFEHLCPEHGWFNIHEEEKIMSDSDPTEGDPTELEVEVAAAPQFCNHLTRNNTLCRVPVSDDSACGYHSSNVQRAQEVSLKETIVSILNETLDIECSLSDFPLDQRCPAYDLLRYLTNHLPRRAFTFLEDNNCDHNFTQRIDGIYVCTLCQQTTGESP